MTEREQRLLPLLFRLTAPILGAPYFPSPLPLSRSSLHPPTHGAVPMPRTSVLRCPAPWRTALWPGIWMRRWAARQWRACTRAPSPR